MKIEKLEVRKFRGKDVDWTLHSDVNILTGINGSGKSTLLQLIQETLSVKNNEDIDYSKFDILDEMIIQLENDLIIKINGNDREINDLEKWKNIKVDVVNTFDTPFENSDFSSSFLDIEIEKLIERFTLYQRNILKKITDLLDEGKETAIETLKYIKSNKDLFIKYINDLFSETNKSFDEQDLNFRIVGSENPIALKDLSSGEKQIFIILLKTLLQENKDYIFILDEPEVSLHISWQRKVINYIRALNPNCQIILATHSATLFYLLYEEKEFEIDEIMSKSSINPVSEILKPSPQTDLLEILKNKLIQIKKNKKHITAQRYDFNLELVKLIAISESTAEKIIDLLKEMKISPDVVTLTTLISKITNINDAKYFLKKVSKEQKIKPIQYTLNTIIKKVNTVNDGIDLITALKKDYDIYPDIITFSTLLGKVMTIEDVNTIEEARNYYGIQKNDRYSRKLKVKR